MASRSCEVSVTGVDDEKLMAFLEEFNIIADALLSDSESDGFPSESSEGIMPDMPPKLLKRRRLNLDSSNLSLSNAIDENISNNDTMTEKLTIKNPSPKYQLTRKIAFLILPSLSSSSQDQNMPFTLIPFRYLILNYFSSARF